jgi:hypothetical protein
MHWAQMQAYMLLTGMDRAMYLAENKDTADLYEERVALDKPEAERLVQRAERIVAAVEPPPRLSTDPAWHVCKYCPFHAQCHGTAVPVPTCRSCTHATPTPMASGPARSTTCPKTSHRRAGDRLHRPPVHPILLERIGKPVDVTAVRQHVTTRRRRRHVHQRHAAGRLFQPRDPRVRGQAVPHGLGHMPDVQQWREKYDAKVVG